MNRNKTISFGDKIFARVTRNGRTIFNFVSEKVANMADLLAQLRHAMKDFQGLVMIHVRNYNQGWGDERPLMLYARKISRPELSDEMQSTISRHLNTGRQMLFPWETH